MRLNENNTFIGINPPYQLSVIHSSKLIYPREIYQRGVERKRVELIARDFNEYIVNEPKVSFRNGRYYVMDGQHTIEGSIQQIEPIRRSTAVYAPPEVVDGKPPVYPYTPIRSSFENAGSIEDMMLYTELQSAVHAMIQRLEYSFTFNPSLLTSPKRKQQVAEILEEAEKYIWRIKEEMRCA